MSNENKRKLDYDKLTPEQKAIYDMVTQNLENGAGIWKPGWKQLGPPESIRGTKYHGINNFLLTLTAMARGYGDNRWITYNQIKERGWSFKTDEENRSLGKGAGVPVEFFDMRDKNTHKPFDRLMLLGMDADERQQYIEENKYFVRKLYYVFNGDLVDGIPEKEHVEIDETARNEQAEKVIEYWNENESKIIYGGDEAYYVPDKDEIHLPPRSEFYNLNEFYGTALHEAGHSTGHATRLNRDLSGKFGTPDYAEEELRAEIASMFIMQNVGANPTESHIQNNKAYLQSWLRKIKDNPNVLFGAIADADKISKYIIEKSNVISEQKPQTESENDGITDTVEVTDDMVQAESKQRGPLDESVLSSIKEESSEEYKLPSEIADDEKKPAPDMTGKGMESLTRMGDREIVEKAKRTKSGEKFSALFNGLSVYDGGERDLKSLAARIGMFTTDKEQMLRIIKASGQYRADKPDEYYSGIADQTIVFVNQVRGNYEKQREAKRNHAGFNTKT